MIQNDELINIIQTSDIFIQIINALRDNKPFAKKELNSALSRQIFRAESGTYWYSYNNAAWNHRVSGYQFKSPAEEFAEAYASYHLSSPKGAKTPEPFKKWFEENGLADMHRQSVLESSYYPW